MATEVSCTVPDGCDPDDVAASRQKGKDARSQPRRFAACHTLRSSV